MQPALFSERTHPAVLCRSIAGISPALRTLCLPGAITLLTDEGGADIGEYENFFLSTEKSSVAATRGSGNLDLAEVALDGFSSSLPADRTAAAFLASAGYGSEEVEAMLDLFDLRRTSYLRCAQLPETAARQLCLLGLLRSEKSVWVLRDPFLPFSGRWREYFAQLVLEEMAKRSLVVICTRVSFIPQCWSRSGDVQSIDVGRLAERARERANREREAQLLDIQDAENAKSSTRMGATVETDSTIVIPIHEDLGKFYDVAEDWLWAPLAALGNRMRTYAWPLAALGLAMSLAIVSTTFFPNLGALQTALSTLDFSAQPPAISNGPTVALDREMKSPAAEDVDFALTGGQGSPPDDDYRSSHPSAIVYSHEPLGEVAAVILSDELLNGETCAPGFWPMSWQTL